MGFRKSSVRAVPRGESLRKCSAFSFAPFAEHGAFPGMEQKRSMLRKKRNSDDRMVRSMTHGRQAFSSAVFHPIRRHARSREIAEVFGSRFPLLRLWVMERYRAWSRNGACSAKKEAWTDG